MAKDIIINAPFNNGDWNIDVSDQQHIEHVCMAAPGHYKNAPLLGVNLMNYVNSPMSPKTVSQLEREIRLNLESDGCKNIVINIDPETKNIYTDGTY